MINVNQITAQMARMPDAALQRYAQMNKSDPYIVSLALSEANRRKEIRTGAQMNAPQQPKVVDQELAGMAQPMPENVGIGQLPAQNLQGMATGGIVAFDEGGEVPRYQSQGLVQMPSAGSPYAIPGFGPGATQLGVTPQEGSQEDMPLLWRLFEEAKKAPKRGAAKNYAPDKAQTPAPAAAPAPAITLPPAANTSQTPPAAGPSASANQQTQQITPPPTPPAPPAAPAAPAAPRTGGISDIALTPEAAIKQREAIASGQNMSVPTQLTEGYARIANLKEAAEKEGLAQLEADIAKRGEAFTDREARLKERETRLGKEESQTGPMALIEAGLAIMGGSSPYALQNIGAGATVGLKSYKAGLKDLAEARDKLDDAFGRIEEYRRTENTMNDKERRAAQQRIKQPAIEAEQLGVAALTDKWKLNEQQATDVFKTLSQNRLTVFEQEQQNKRTAMTVQGQKDIAGMLPGEARTAMMLGTGNTEQAKLKSGLEVVAQIQAGKKTMQQAYEDYLKAWAGKDTTAGNMLTPQQYYQQIQQISMLGSKPPAAVDATGKSRP
jgi:hypothetical protein